jgi:LacI family transcriptional regulator, gluconate utilization system Gnt-I transcriptional repressor
MPPSSRTLPRRPSSSAANVTLADVARVAGVSKITASRALANPGIVSPETRERVRKATLETGYVPNLLPIALRLNRTKLITCSVPTIGSGSVFMDAVQAMTEAFKVAGYQVLLGQRGYDATQEEQLVGTLLARRPDGVVFMGTVRSTAARQRLQNSGTPIVEAWDISDDPVDTMVGFSHKKVGAATARYLHKMGRCRFGIVSIDEPRGEQRAQGFIEAARRLGLLAKGLEIPRARFPAPSRMRHGREGVARLLDEHPDLDAIYCATDLVALGALTEARLRGLAVPNQLAIIGFGDADFAADTDPPLSTVHVDSVALGQRTAELLIERIEGRMKAGEVLDIGFKLVKRATA